MIEFVQIGHDHAIPIAGEVGEDGRITWYGECQLCHCTEDEPCPPTDGCAVACSWANPQRTLCPACVLSSFQQLAVPSPEDCTP